MERSKIKELLDKYLEGETSLAEEKKLREYFTSSAIDPAFEEFKPLFTFFEKEQEIKYIEKPKINKTKKISFQWLSIAASIVLVCSVYFFSQQKEEHNNTRKVNHELAMKNTQDLLYMMTNVMNDGKNQLKYLKEFETTKNQIIRNK
ncbi:hypothetical protein [Mesonia aquimarina]|uniref:hypothetical protein n=1 Tax=Mesonia aquimarina TaxID=1504967 RepID=UPI000EF58C64|nr:hypothetical protein [Mesonia aquimarina]